MVDVGVTEVKNCIIFFFFPPLQFEQSMYPQVCKLILQSYNISMEDCQEVVDAKLKFIDRLVERLGSSSRGSGSSGSSQGQNVP